MLVLNFKLNKEEGTISPEAAQVEGLPLNYKKLSEDEIKQISDLVKDNVNYFESYNFFNIININNKIYNATKCFPPNILYISKYAKYPHLRRYIRFFYQGLKVIKTKALKSNEMLLIAASPRGATPAYKDENGKLVLINKDLIQKIVYLDLIV